LRVGLQLRDRFPAYIVKVRSAEMVQRTTLH
jgi:hypothetical protein